MVLRIQKSRFWLSLACCKVDISLDLLLTRRELPRLVCAPLFPRVLFCEGMRKGLSRPGLARIDRVYHLLEKNEALLRRVGDIQNVLQSLQSVGIDYCRASRLAPLFKGAGPAGKTDPRGGQNNTNCILLLLRTVPFIFR